jgi:transcriptional regulator of acetoin/glycerol metabolism
MDVLVSQGKFCKELYNELQKAKISLPSLVKLPESEMYDLTDKITEQSIQRSELKHIFDLNEKEKLKIINDKPLSLHEFKQSIYKILKEKSESHYLYDTHTTSYSHAHNIADPEIAQAVHLGKKALKDPHIMSILWNKFQNQNKIATLLGVNRSSVNRRCKEYSLV